MRARRPSLNIIEAAMLCVLAGVLAYLVGQYRTEHRLGPYLSAGILEVRPLAERFGPSRHSRNFEEWIVRDYFNDARSGVFVDVGANHYQDDSNTYYLETALGWSGVAVEPQADFAGGYAEFRPRTIFVPLFVSDVSNSRAVLYVPGNNSLVASATREFVALEGGQDVEPLESNTATLDDILSHHQIDRIDFLSIDIELHEPAALRGFAIEKYAPRLAGIESHPQVRQEILDYFTAHRYVVVGKYLRIDSHNLWFEPMSARLPGSTQ